MKQQQHRTDHNRKMPQINQLIHTKELKNGV
jgi:hypothetical protein